MQREYSASSDSSGISHESDPTFGRRLKPAELIDGPNPESAYLHGRIGGVYAEDSRFTISFEGPSAPTITVQVYGPWTARLWARLLVGHTIRLSTRGSITRNRKAEAVVSVVYRNGILLETSGRRDGRQVDQIFEIWHESSSPPPQKKRRMSYDISDLDWFATPHRPSRYKYQHTSSSETAPPSLAYSEGPYSNSPSTSLCSSPILIDSFGKGPIMSSLSNPREQSPKPLIDGEGCPLSHADTSSHAPGSLSTIQPNGRSGAASERRQHSSSPSPSPAPGPSVGKKGHRKERRFRKARKNSAPEQQTPQPDFDQSPPRLSTPPESQYSFPYAQGLRTTVAHYVPLAEIRDDEKVSFIAVVTSSREIRRATAGTCDLRQCVTLLDHSNIESHGSFLFNNEAGMKAMMFTATYEQWLPCPKQGDVLVGYMAKSDIWDGVMTLKGYRDTFKWAIFDPIRNDFAPPELGNAPESVVLQDGFGTQFSPFLYPGLAELDYCRELSRWWDSVLKKREQRVDEVVRLDGQVHQGTPTLVKHRKREHQLISDVDLSVLNGFFDCTVEVLHSRESNGGPSTVFVTDYTAKPGMREVIADWCPANLSTKTLRIEMWLGAEQLSSTMKPGEFWNLNNMRIKVARDGYLEGTFSQVEKARKLTAKNGDTDNVHLVALLRRKAQWEASNASPNVFEYKTLCEAVEREFFDCVVEVLHSVYSEEGPSKVYVTDYTARPSFDSSIPRIGLPWVKNAQKQIVMLELRGGQSCVAESMKPGMFFAIKNLRLVRKGEEKLMGQLGGHDKLIHQLDDDSDDDKLTALLERKGRVLQNCSSDAEVDYPCGGIDKSAVDALSTISQVRTSERCPSTFKLRARVAAYEPTDLNASIVRVCTACDDQSDPGVATCVRCGSRKFKHKYELVFLLCDGRTEGDVLPVAVDQTWHVLRGLEPDELVGEGDIDEILMSRLKPYVGHIGRDSLTQTEWHEFSVESWEVPEEDGEFGRSYGLC